MKKKTTTAIPTKPGEHSLGEGLSVLVADTGNARYFTYYWADIPGTDQKKRTKHWIGNAKLFTLDDAREEVIKVRKGVKRGADPKEGKVKQRLALKVVPAFLDYAETIMAEILPTLKNEEHKKKWRTSIINHTKPMARIPVDKVTRTDVLACLLPIWQKIPVQASEVRGRIERIFDCAIADELRTEANPATYKVLERRLITKPPKSGATRGSHKCIPVEAMGEFMPELVSYTQTSARALEVTILTVARTQEMIRMRRNHLDLDAAIWTVPIADLKMDHGLPHTVPLSARAVELLRAQIAEVEEAFSHCDYIWPGEGKKNPHISTHTMLQLLQRDMKQEATVHGFRATFKTWAGRQLRSDGSPKYGDMAIEFCLAHLAGPDAARAYQRDGMIEQRAVIMRDWAAFCRQKKVVKLRDAA